MSLVSDERVEELLAKEAAQEAEIARLRAALERIADENWPPKLTAIARKALTK